MWEKEPVKIMQELGSHWLRHIVVVQLIVVHLKLSWPTAELNICKVTCGLFCIIKHILRRQYEAQFMDRARNRAQNFYPPNGDPTRCTLSSPSTPCCKAWYVLNTLSSSQHVFSLQFFISNIHLGFGLLSNAMWMETRCLFWTQQNKRRVTEPILPQSKLVLTTTPTVGDRLCGTGPVLI